MKLIRKRKETLMKEANYAISQDRSQHTLFLIRRLSVYILMDCVTIYSVCHLQLPTDLLPFLVLLDGQEYRKRFYLKSSDRKP